MMSPQITPRGFWVSNINLARKPSLATRAIGGKFSASRAPVPTRNRSRGVDHNFLNRNRPSAIRRSDSMHYPVAGIRPGGKEAGAGRSAFRRLSSSCFSGQLLGALMIGIVPYPGEFAGLNLDLFGLHDSAPFWSVNLRISTRRARQYSRYMMLKIAHMIEPLC